MAKFKAGDTIAAKIDGSWMTLFVNRVFFRNGQEMYSLDNGNGATDLADSTESIDRDFSL
jgi:hypothetical protein